MMFMFEEMTLKYHWNLIYGFSSEFLVLHYSKKNIQTRNTVRVRVAHDDNKEKHSYAS